MERDTDKEWLRAVMSTPLSLPSERDCDVPMWASARPILHPAQPKLGAVTKKVMRVFDT